MHKNEVDIDLLYKLDIRVCEILEAERIPKSNKLLKLKINTGFDERISVTNIGGKIEPQKLIGKKLPFVLNLHPAKMMGVETHAMIFITNDENGYYLESYDVEVGSKFV
jgi:methionyl-tRNA synthetase